MQNRLKPPRSKGQELCWEPRGDHLNLHVWIKQQSYTSSSFDLRWFCLNWFTSNISLRDSKASLSEDTPTRSCVSPAPQVFSFMLPVLAPLGTVRQWNNCTLWDFMCQNEENQFLSPNDLSLQDTTKNCWLLHGSGVFKGNFYKKKDTNWESNGAYSLRIYIRGRGQLK